MALYSGGYFISQAILGGIRDYEERKRLKEEEKLKKKTAEAQIKQIESQADYYEKSLELENKKIELQKQELDNKNQLLAFQKKAESLKIARQLIDMGVDLNDPKIVDTFGEGIVALSKQYKIQIDDIFNNYQKKVLDLNKTITNMNNLIDGGKSDDNENITRLQAEIDNKQSELQSYIIQNYQYLSKNQFDKLNNLYKIDMENLNKHINNIKVSIRRDLTKILYDYKDKFDNIIKINNTEKQINSLSDLSDLLDNEIKEINNDSMTYFASTDSITKSLITDIYSLKANISNYLSNIYTQEQNFNIEDMKEVSKTRTEVVENKYNNSIILKLHNFLIEGTTNNQNSLNLKIPTLNKKEQDNPDIEKIKIGNKVYNKEDVLKWLSDEANDFSELLNDKSNKYILTNLTRKDTIKVKGIIDDLFNKYQTLYDYINSNTELNSEKPDEQKEEAKLKTNIGGKYKNKKENKEIQVEEKRDKIRSPVSSYGGFIYKYR